MRNFVLHFGGKAQQQPAVDADELIRQLGEAVKAQLEAENISPVQVQKFTELVTDTTRLKVVKNFL